MVIDDSSDIARLLVEALNYRDDFEALAGLLDKDSVWFCDAFASLKGPDAIIDYVKRLRQTFPDFRVLLLARRRQARNRTVFQFQFSGTQSGFMQDVGITDKRAVLRGAAFVDFKGKTVTEVTTYWNCTPFLAQLGVRAHMRPDPVGARYAFRELRPE